MNDIFKDETFLSSVLDTMTDGLMVVDKEGTILSFNRAAERMTGYSASEVLGKNCEILDTDTCVMGGERKNCSLFEEGSVTRKGCRIRAKDGGAVHLLKNAVVLRDEKGDVIGGVETMTDITSLVMKDMQIEELKKDISREYGFMGMLGTSSAMKNVFGQIENAARSGAPVMIYGESGTGKELVASAVHRLSGRREGPFIKVNCAALNESLLESELFGHKRGSFTGALRDRKGRFEAASGGTIFLDEIGDMPLSMQVKLLRVLEQKEVERVGDNTPVSVDIRLVTATNRNIYELVDGGAFREDLLYRVNVVPINIPPLRERAEDLPLIVAHYLKRVSYVNNKEIRSVNPRAMEILKAYHWPGNIRQLINTLEYSAITCKGAS
ncbi:MAG: sigma 54-interacting transcriptional regulator, partial [Nitrospirota bacterium]